MSQSKSDDQEEDSLAVVSKSLWALVGGFVAVGIVIFAVLLLVVWSLF